MRTMTVSLSVLWRGALAMACLAGTCAWAEVSGNIDPTNKYAWAENIGWIHFENTSPAYNVETTARLADGTIFMIR